MSNGGRPAASWLTKRCPATGFLVPKKVESKSLSTELNVLKEFMRFRTFRRLYTDSAGQQMTEMADGDFTHTDLLLLL